MSPEAKPASVATALKCSYEDALDKTGFGRYTITMLLACCLLMLAMCLDIFGFSVALPAVACDLNLTTGQQALLSAIPLIGVMLSSYAWGLSADTLGRRQTLQWAMTVGVVLSLVGTIAPNFATLAVLKFLSAGFTASANATAFVLLGETTPKRQRNQLIFLMASVTMLTQFLISLFALPVYQLTFRINIPWLAIEYRPWRLLLLIISMPGVIGIVIISFLKESPKFLLSKGREREAMDALRFMHVMNFGNHKEYLETAVYLEEIPTTLCPSDKFLRRVWKQTAPLFKAPLLMNNAKLYLTLMCAYMTSTGYTMWVPTMTNAFFTGQDRFGLTFCEVASTAVKPSNVTSVDCDNVVPASTLYAVMLFSGCCGLANLLLSCIVAPLGRRRTTLLVFTISAMCGSALLFVRLPLLSIALFYVFIYVAIVLGNINSYLVELNPTYLRGMAACLSMVVARGAGFVSVHLIARLLSDHCTYMISGYVALVIVGGFVAFHLPPDKEPNIDGREKRSASRHSEAIELSGTEAKQMA